jgi:hypothetical protein
MPLSEIAARFDPTNPKDHDIGEICESLKRFGYVRKIELNDHQKDKYILLGHGTAQALIMMRDAGESPPAGIELADGDWSIQVVRGHKIKSSEARAYRIADNKLSELGGYNESQLIDNLIDISKGKMDLTGTGFDGDSLDHLIRLYRPDLIDEKDVSEVVFGEYLIIIECESELEQSKYLKEFLERKIKCRALIS